MSKARKLIRMIESAHSFDYRSPEQAWDVIYNNIVKYNKPDPDFEKKFKRLWDRYSREGIRYLEEIESNGISLDNRFTSMIFSDNSLSSKYPKIAAVGYLDDLIEKIINEADLA